MLKPIVGALAGVFGELVADIITALTADEDWEPIADQFPEKLKMAVEQELKREETLEELRRVRHRYVKGQG